MKFIILHEYRKKTIWFQVKGFKGKFGLRWGQKKGGKDMHCKWILTYLTQS
jgi:hypothetical protein